MGLFDNFKREAQARKLARSIVQEGTGFTKAASGGGTMLSALASMLQPKWAEAPSRDTKDWLELYNNSPRLDPVHKIAEDVASADWGLYKELADGEKEKILEHPLIDLFNKPNPLPETTWFTFMYMTEAYLYLTGEAYWVLERSGLNQITEMWMLPTHWVISTPNQGQDYYEVQTPDGSRMNVPSEDMVYIKEPNLANPYGRGRGRAKSIGEEIETDEYMARWSKNFFYNNAQPPIIIEAPGAGKTDVDRMQESWMQKYSGIRNAHKPAFLPFAGKVHQLSQTQKEMDYVESRKFLRDQANQHFRVPPELMGIIENSNRATIDAADYIYRSSVLINRLTMIEQAIQHQIIERFFESEGIQFTFDNVVPDDKEFELKAASEGLKLGTVTIDEWRQKNGWDPLDNGMGAVFLIPAGVVPVTNPIDAASAAMAIPGAPLPDNTPPNGPAPKPPEKEEEEEEEDESASPQPEPEEDDSQQRTFVPIQGWREKGVWEDESVVKTVADEFDTSLSSLEKKHAKNIEKFMIAQGKRIASFVSKQDIKEVFIIRTKADDEPSDEELEEAERQADELLNDYDWVGEDEKLYEEMEPALLEAAEEGAALANGLFELGIAFNLIREEMLDHIRSAGFDKVVGITGTTKALLRKTVIEGMLQGEGSPALAKRIRRVSSEYAYNRSFVIARTESHSTMVKGSLETYKQAGASKKKWLTVNDGRERKSHKRLNGTIIAIDEKFSNKCMHPGDSRGPAEEVIQCRCALVPVFDE